VESVSVPEQYLSDLLGCSPVADLIDATLDCAGVLAGFPGQLGNRFTTLVSLKPLFLVFPRDSFWHYKLRAYVFYVAFILHILFHFVPSIGMIIC